MTEVVTVGELRDALEAYDDDTPVYVNDDGRRMLVSIREADGVIEL